MSTPPSKDRDGADLLSPQEREDILAELLSIARLLDELPDDAYIARVDLRERQRVLRDVVRRDDDLRRQEAEADVADEDAAERRRKAAGPISIVQTRLDPVSSEAEFLARFHF